MKNKNKPRKQTRKQKATKPKQVELVKPTKPTKRPFNPWVYKYFDMTNVGDDKHKESL